MFVISLPFLFTCPITNFILISTKQLPTPTWMSEQDEIVAWYEDRDLPVSIGGTGYGNTPTKARVARW